MEVLDEVIEKIYFTSGEASAICGLNSSAIRFYESEFNINVMRTHGGKRKYRKEDIELIKLIDQLTAYFHLAGIKKLIEEKRVEAFAWMIIDEPAREGK
jgi:DNA-binding transcriptional MerR regulator